MKEYDDTKVEQLIAEATEKGLLEPEIDNEDFFTHNMRQKDGVLLLGGFLLFRISLKTLYDIPICCANSF